MHLQKAMRAGCLLAWLALPSLGITIQATRVLDGRGAVLENVRITVEDTRIVGVEPGHKGSADYNLQEITVMPGWIDTHVHIGWHFNKQDRADTTKETPTGFAINASGNAYLTLMAGFTTVQSLGANMDADLRDAIARGVIPGPRLITSLEPLNEKSGTSEPDARSRAPACSARSRCDQDFCYEEHP